MNGVMVFAAAMVILNIIGVVWSGMKLGHPVLVSWGYIIGLIVIGKINGNACLVVALIVAAITLIVLIVKLVLLIVEIGGYANQNSKQDRLLKAIKQNDKESVEKLIAEGAFVNGNYDGIDKFPLQVAVENCDEAMISLLLEKGADVNNFKENGKPFATAVKKGDKKIVSLLLEKGANVNVGYDGKLPLDFAENEEIIALLKSHDAITQSEKWKRQRMLNENLLIAMNNRQTDIAKDLVLHGADVNCSSSDIDFSENSQLYNHMNGLTPLMYAVLDNDIEMVKFLLENGAEARKEVWRIGGNVNAIQIARYAIKNEDIADLLEYS